jgi:hypothetical protein
VADRPRARAALRLPLEVGASSANAIGWKVVGLVGLVAMGLAAFDGARRGLWLSALTVAFAFVLGSALARLRARREGGAASPDAWLVIDDEEIVRVEAGSARPDGRGKTSLARWGAPFGLSVLANAARSRVLLAFTSPAATRFLGMRVETSRDADVARDVLGRAVTVADVDLEQAAGPNPSVQLGAAAAKALLTHIEARDPAALQRMYLSDARGGAVVVERDRLLVGGETVDLGSPVDWRVFTFQDGDAGLYQATSVKQGASDVVFVCRAPAEVLAWGVGRVPDAAPPRENRIAIDRLFMTPLRAVLEQAPRVSRPPTLGSRTRRPTEAR